MDNLRQSIVAFLLRPLLWLWRRHERAVFAAVLGPVPMPDPVRVVQCGTCGAWLPMADGKQAGEGTGRNEWKMCSVWWGWWEYPSLSLLLSLLRLWVPSRPNFREYL